jgi:hypothetical protein
MSFKPMLRLGREPSAEGQTTILSDVSDAMPLFARQDGTEGIYASRRQASD